MDEEKKIDFKGYLISFLIFSASAGLSFFIGFKIGKDIGKEELRKEIAKSHETGLEEVLKRVFEKQEETQPEKQKSSTHTAKENLLTEKGEKAIPQTQEESQKGITETYEKKEQINQTYKEKENEEEVQKEETQKSEEKKIQEDKEETSKSEKNSRTEKTAKMSKKEKENAEKIGERISFWESGGRWTVQVASFETEEKAKRFAEKLKREYGFPAYIVKATTNGKNIYRVRVGKVKKKEDAQKLLSLLKSKGFNGLITF